MSNFDCSMKFHQICILIGSLCCKYIKVQLKKNRGFMSHEDWCKIWRKTDLLFQKYKNLLNFDLSTQNSQNFHFGSFCAKYVTFDLKKPKGVIFHDTEEWCKIWRKTDLWFGKWHEEFGKFSPEHLKVSKLGFWWDPFVQSRKGMTLKFTEELCVMTMKNDAKFEEELTCQFKIDMRNLTNFDPSTRKSQKFAL